MYINSGSKLGQNSGSGSKFNVCGSTTLGGGLPLYPEIYTALHNDPAAP